MTDPILTDKIRALNDEPLYWIVRNYEWCDDLSTHALCGYVSNNNDRYRWCSYDDKGKEYVEWDSANVDTNTLASSVPNAVNQVAPAVEWKELIDLVNRAIQTRGPATTLNWLRIELQFQMNQHKLDSRRSLKLLKQLEKFDPEAALELCE